VTYAHQAPLDSVPGYGTFGSSKYRRGAAEANKPTTLSLLKGAEIGKKQG
jgi:hypothetical protein